MNNTSFDYKRIAEGYAKDRPFLHGQVMERLQKQMAKQMSKGGQTKEQKYNRGLDIGCGAGLSTKALHMICQNVLGTDISPEMIMAAKALYSEEGFTFEVSKAEEIKAEKETFDVVTAAGVINWVDETLFLPVLYDILSDQGIFLIYDFWISDQMEGKEAYTKWWHEEYLPRFPRPKRKENVWTNDDVKPYHFEMMEQETYVMTYPMELDHFIRFMLIQSNVIAQVEENGKSFEDAKQWFESSLSRFWGTGKEILLFQGYSWYIRKDFNAGSNQERR